MTISPKTAKWVHAAVGTLIGSLTDLAAQLAQGQYVNAPRTVIVGLVVGLVMRVAGKILEATTVNE